ncbi:two-component regulator propeller domain-containing protein [Flammeovirga sp. SJP92]|uniref:hybrid sensor histidine kinase/response regulator transcription factor n=1 Tax=Flammeovirga sp. SJP92 TaxID=1775430 RepID=UPI0007890A43|nr:two-component regulator propeller domain-containing protein [Flammeovirga sp. SJP92]KXX67155.1 hypothetical protein AVL50_27595 [Flammeovirga sp. SJP92]
MSNSIWANEVLNFRTLNPEKGLSHINVTSILQDKHGYIWLGTNNGINQYDGFTVKNYYSSLSEKVGLSSNRISTMYESKAGDLWVGTRDAGLNKFISQSYGFEQYTAGQAFNITSINEDKNGNIWVGELRKGLGLLDIKKKKVAFFQPMDAKVIISEILPLPSGDFLIGTRGSGLYFFNLNTKKFTKVIGHEFLEEGSIRGLILTGTSVFVATYNSIYALEIDENQVSTIKKLPVDESITAISSICLKENQLWVGTKSGLFHVSLLEDYKTTSIVSEKNVLNSLVSNNINSLLIDKSNILWVGTSSGSSYVNLQSLSLRTVHLSALQKENVNVVYEDRLGQTWFGLKSGKLVKYANNTTVEYSSDSKSNYNLNAYGGVEALCEDDYGNLWIGSWGGGLHSISLKEEKAGRAYFKRIDNKYLTSKTITSLAFYDNALFVGTFRKGLNKLSIDKKGNVLKSKQYWRKSEELPLMSNTINYMYVDPFEKCLWTSTPSGLAKIKRKGKKLTYKVYNVINIDGKVNSAFCWEICRSSRSTLWVGTIEKGLSKLTFDPKSLQLVDIKTYTTKDGLPSNSIQSLVFDSLSNYLWVGGKNLTAFDTENEITHVFNTDDGIEGGYFRVNCATQLSDGSLCFASDKALNYILAGKILENKHLPHTIINSLYVFGQPIEQGQELDGEILLEKPLEETQEIIFQHFQNNIEIGFNAMHFGNPEKNSYQYMMEGFDKKWMTTDRRSVVYSNLPFGNYVFKVKSANSDGVWEEAGQEIKITVLTPWWRTKLAYLIYLLIIVAIVYKINRMVINKHKLEQSLELERYKIEKNEELTLMKIRFFVNISHELRTPLTLISSPLETLLKNTSLESNVTEYLNIMKRNSDRLLVLFDQLLDFRKIETGNHKVKFKHTDIVNFTRLVASSFNTLAKDNDINYSFHSFIDFQEAWMDEDIIEKVVYNLVSNSFKNTNEGGDILVELSSNNDDHYQIAITDTGKGIPAEEQEHIFEEFYQTQNKTDRGTGLGLSLVKRLIDAHYGTITFESKEGEGTRFVVTLPLSDDFMKPEEKVVEEVINEVSDEAEVKTKEDHRPKILIVEDNLDIAHYLKKELEHLFSVTLAHNGKEGYQQVVKMKPDVVISDIMMAEMNGIELCKEIKKNPHLNHIPVILLTAKSADEDRLEGIESGADAYIIKPFKTEFLLAKVMNLIEERKLTKQFYASKKDENVTQEDPEKDTFIKKAKKVIEDNLLNEGFDSKAFAKEMGLTYATLYNRLKKYENESATGYIRKIRLEKAAELIANSDHSIKEIQFLVGFNDAKYFRTNFKKLFDITPSDYMKKYRKVDLKSDL